MYFAFFSDGGTSYFSGRVGITAATDGSDFTFGLFSGSTTVASQFASGFHFGTDYRVVVEYDQVNKLSKLWVNPTSELSSSISYTDTYGDPFNYFAFRQATGATSSQVIDNLVIATTFNEANTVPEPATMSLLGLGSLFFVRRK